MSGVLVVVAVVVVVVLEAVAEVGGERQRRRMSELGWVMVFMVRVWRFCLFC